MGWRPLVTYARLPLENLRVSDLGLLSVPKRSNAFAALRAKVAACTGVPTRRISGADVVRLFVTRIGRIAGLCEVDATSPAALSSTAFSTRRTSACSGNWWTWVKDVSSQTPANWKPRTPRAVM